MKLLPVILPLTLGLALIGGCKGGDSASSAGETSANVGKKPASSQAIGSNQIAGDWTGTMPQSAGATSKFTFGTDGTYSEVMDSPFPGKKSSLVSTVKGAYTQAGDALTMHTASMRLSSADPTQKEDMAAENAMFKKGKLPDMLGTLEWKDKDNVTLTIKSDPSSPGASPGESEVHTLKRKA